MTTKNIALLKEDIQTLLKSNNDYSLLEKIKSLLSFDLMKLELNDSGAEYVSMTDEEIIKRVDITNEEIRKGKTISQDKLFKDSQNW